jgi:chitin disaccharide deacetylase
VPRLIINADDFGLTPGVNRSILELHQAHTLTSATLMATAQSFASAVEGASHYPPLGVGCHVVLVDGLAASAPAQIPSLADSAGQFRVSLGQFVQDLYRRRISGDEIEREAVAQIRRLQQAGVRVTHLDTHKHTHLFPAVLRPLLRAALQCGVRAIRNPFEPDWSLEATHGASRLRRWQVRLLRTQRRSFHRLVSHAGLHTTDGAIGVLATGVLDAALLERLLQRIPAGTWELVCHPGHPDTALDAVRTRLRASRAVEHAALAQILPRFPNLQRIHFGELQAAPS